MKRSTKQQRSLSPRDERVGAKQRELETLRVRLARRDRDLSQLALVTSQDLRTPLRGINHLVQWIEEDLGGDDNAELKEHLRLLRGRTHRLERTIRALHQYACIGELPSNASSVNVGVMVQALARKLDPEGKLDIDVAELPTMVAARGLLQRVFQGLLENAAEHHRAGDGAIRVRARELTEGWEFCVVSGDREQNADAARLFQRLYEQSLRAEEAIDLGLMLVRRIVEDQGGSTSVRLGIRDIPSVCFTWPKGVVDP